MKKIIVFVLLIFYLNPIYAQSIKHLKKIKCFQKMPQFYEQIEKLDTLYILFTESSEKGFEQELVNLTNHDFNNYNFYQNIFFPLDIYEFDMFTKINFRKPHIMYASKSFICKNAKKIIDVYFLKKFSYEINFSFYKKKRTTFIINLDSKIKNKYKIIEVNIPTYVIE